MDKNVIVQLHASFEEMVQKNPETGTEFWLARDLQMLHKGVANIKYAVIGKCLDYRLWIRGKELVNGKR